MNFSSLFVGDLERRLWRWWQETSPAKRIFTIFLAVLIGGAIKHLTEPVAPSYLKQEQDRAAYCAEILAKTRATGKSDEKTAACLILLSIEGDRLRLQ
jgi:hypothetical protein